MKKLLPILLIALILPFSLRAQSAVDSLYVDTRAAYNGEIIGQNYSSRFFADHLNLHVYGKLTDSLRFRVRHRLNVAPTAVDPLKATDWLCLIWKPAPKLTLTLGKQAIFIGGYEYDSVPIDVYFWSRFCNGLPQGFSTGISVDYELLPGQIVSAQIANTPLDFGFSESFAYSIGWKGHILPEWSTIWTANLVEDPAHRFIRYFALGNHVVLGDLALDLDLIDRAGFGQKNLLSDYSIIGKAIWSVGKWNICGKLGYEFNSADNVDADGNALDVAMPLGYSAFYGGTGLEYFPLADNKLRLHAIWFRESTTHNDNFQVGVTWRFDIINRK